MYYTVLGTAVAEDHSREASSGNLSRYTAHLHNWPILLANAITLVFSLVILILKVRYR